MSLVSVNAAGVAPTIVMPGLQRDTVAADLGNYFTAITPTPGTGIIGHAICTTLVETKPMFVLYNGGALNIYPTYLRLTLTTIPVGNTMQQFTVALDQGNRIATAATALTINNTNMYSPTTSGAQISVGAVVATAPSSQRRIINHRPFRPTVIGVAGDVYQFSWGSSQLVDPSALPVDGTLRAHIMYVCSPLVVASGCSLLVHAWGATFSTGAVYEYEFGFVEK